MKIDTTLKPLDHKGKPFNHCALDTATLWLRVKQLRDRGMTDASSLIEAIETEVGGFKDLIKPMDLADCFSQIIEWSDLYNGKEAAPKKSRAKLLRLLCTEGIVELTEEHVAILKADIQGPRVSGTLMLALEEALEDAAFAERKEVEAKKAQAQKGAELVAVEDKVAG